MMRLKSTIVVLFSVLCISMYGAKKPIVSLGIYGGFSAASLFSAAAPFQESDYDLIKMKYTSDGVKNLPDHFDPYKTYMPNRITKAEMLELYPHEEYPYYKYPFGDKAFDYTASFIRDMIYNLVGGLTFDVPLKGDFAFKSAFSIQNMGLDLNNEVTSIVSVDENFNRETILYRRNVKNTYLIVPFLLKYSWPHRTTYYVQAGPYAGFLLNSKVRGSSSITTPVNNEWSTTGYEFSVDTAKFQTNMLDLGLSFGGGIEFYWTSTASITLELSTGIGLRKIDKLYNNDYTEYEHDRKYLTDYTSQNYFSLSSRSRNFYVMFTVGFRYSVYK